MRLLKKTKEADRITANLVIHKRIMDKYVLAGKSGQDASRLAMVDLQQIPTKDRIDQANELRRVEAGADGLGLGISNEEKARC